MTYFSGQIRSCQLNGIVIWRMPIAFAKRLISSCAAPKGQSQPQNGPRPQNSIETAVPHHRMKTSGSSRNCCEVKLPETMEFTKVKTLTTESCALAQPPIQTTLKMR